MKSEYENKYQWAISTQFRGETDILEMFIMYYYKKAKILTLGIQKPTKRILDIIDRIKNENNINNLELIFFDSDFYEQAIRTNQIYKHIMSKYKDIDFYAQVDIDEFIYRFDLIEEAYQPNTIYKFHWANVFGAKDNNKICYSQIDPYLKLEKDALHRYGKVIYCVGEDWEHVVYGGGQHDMFFDNKDISERNLKWIEFPVFWHIPYRNKVQTYSKISNLLKNFTQTQVHIDEIFGAHVLRKFLDLYSDDYLRIFNDEKGDDLFVISLNENSLDFFMNQTLDLPEDQLHEIDQHFLIDYYEKYYNEENSLLDFIEEDFIYKMNLYKKSWHLFNDLEKNNNKKPLLKRLLKKP